MLRSAVVEELNRILGDDAKTVDVARFLDRPPRPELGDLAFGCFPLAKIRRRSPAEVAAELAQAVRPGGLIRGAKAEGPYLNFVADHPALLAATCKAAAAGELERASVVDASRVMVEFSQPNTHKPFHVGHLRNVVIGDALVRLNRACGREVVSANYYGDYGIDVAKCLWWLRTHPEAGLPSEDRSTFLGQAYVDGNALLEADPANAAGVREVLRAMNDRDPEVWALYQQTREWCLEEFGDVYRWLDVDFDVAFYESQMEEPGNRIVDEYLAKGVFTLSEGAVVCDLQPDLDVPALLRKRDGTSLYMTWDLALAKRKFDEYGLDRSIYVVGSEQRFHFRQLFLALERMGYERAKDCEHVAYELVVLPEGKMSSRNGTAVPLSGLRRAVSEVVARRLEAAEARVDPADKEEVVRRVAVASLKYGMLSIGVNKRVVYSLDEWTNPEGDTGAYLLYALARIRSIRRKAAAEGAIEVPPGSTFGEVEEERALLGHLLELPLIIRRATEASDPSVVAGWAYEGTRAFSRFWRACPVLQADPPLRASRLALMETTDRVLTAGLRLLGIEPVDAM